MGSFTRGPAQWHTKTENWGGGGGGGGAESSPLIAIYENWAGDVCMCCVHMLCMFACVHVYVCVHVYMYMCVFCNFALKRNSLCATNTM